MAETFTQLHDRWQREDEEERKRLTDAGLHPNAVTQQQLRLLHLEWTLMIEAARKVGP